MLQMVDREPTLKRVRLWDHGFRYVLIIEGGLRYIKSNRKPYFTITAEKWRANKDGSKDQRFRDCESCGCLHDDIMAKAPEFADLIALHCSDIDGVPGAAEANGWYYLAGFYGGAGEQYHLGNSKGHFGGEYREPTPEECLQLFADHCRVPLAQAGDWADDWRTQCQSSDTACYWEQVRNLWRRECEAMKPRWKTEANTAIAKYDLKVFGDKWPD